MVDNEGMSGKRKMETQMINTSKIRVHIAYFTNAY